MAKRRIHRQSGTGSRRSKKADPVVVLLLVLLAGLIALTVCLICLYYSKHILF